MTAPAVVCHGYIDPERDEERSKIRWHCPVCGRDLVAHDDLLDKLFAPLIEAKVPEVSLGALLMAMQRIRR